MARRGSTWQGQFVVKHETDRAVLVVDTATGEEAWLPLSQVEEMHQVPGAGENVKLIVMSEWIAEQKGFF